jgi:signal transduction histidine kinase
MQEAIANSTGMLKRLVSFSRGDEEGYSLVDMNVMLNQSKELLERALYRESKITFSNSSEQVTVLGNYYELQNVILNIGLNARDALPEKGGEIMIKAWTAETNPLKPGAYPGWYYISIRDNGCGMSAETQKRIFDPFFTTKPQGRGSGLGLFTTYGNLQRHGGTISVESAQGAGTEFVVALPLAVEDDVENNSQITIQQMS